MNDDKKVKVLCVLADTLTIGHSKKPRVPIDFGTPTSDLTNEYRTMGLR